jgi:uncharacterized protein YecT (DUF1311 family)
MKAAIRILGVIALLSGISTWCGAAAIAQAPQPDCKSPQTQLDINICSDRATKVADRKLNETYKRLQARYRNTSNSKNLVDAQLAWISFRDRNCKFAADRFSGGSIAPTIYSRCIERITVQRTDELERYVKGYESRDGL